MRRGFINKRCPKCNGNIFVDQDSNINSGENYYGWYEWCLQCGYTRYLEPAAVLMEAFKVVTEAKEPVIS